jgi:hypothetical protein
LKLRTPSPKEESKRHREIHILNFEIGSANSKLETFDAKSTGEFVEVKGELASLTTTLNKWLKQFHGSPSSKKTSHFEGEDSSHNISFQSNFIHHDPRLPIVEVNKFDGSNPT